MALKALNSVGGFSVGEVPANIILANGDITASNATFSGNLLISNVNAAWGVKTDNLYYSNGTPWDLQEAAGANKQIQFNDGNNNFGASANFTFDYGTQTLNVTGTANVTQTLNGNVGNFSGNITGANLITGGNVQAENIVNPTANTSIGMGNGSGIVAIYSAGNATQFAPSGQITLGGASQIVGGTFGGSGLTLGGSQTDIFQNRGGNVTVQVGTGGSIANTWTFAQDGSFTSPGNIVALNANLGNLVTANYANFANDIVVQGDIANANNVSVTANLSAGNVKTDNLLYANGNPWDLQEAAGANTQLQFNDGNNNFGASANLTFDIDTQTLAVVGNIVSTDSKVTTLTPTQVVYGNANSFLVGASNFTYDDVASNLTIVGNVIATNFIGNISGNLTISAPNTAVIFADDGIAFGTTGFTFDKITNHANIDGNLDVNYSINATNLTSTLEISGNTANFSGNIVALNATLGNSANANFVNVESNTITNNLTVNLELSGNTANFTGNINSALNANLGNLVTANYVKTSEIYNNSSNVRIDYNSNITLSVGGYADIFTLSTTGANVVGYVQANGIISAGGFEGSNLVSNTGNISIQSLQSGDNFVELRPYGNGTVDVANFRITSVSMPTYASDAATKEYVDNVSQGLFIHPAANVTAVTNLNASYLNGGTVLSVTDITGGKTITFSTNHGLVADDDVEFTNSFNGIIAGEGYFVFSAPTLDTITIKDGYFGVEVTTLTNGSGLTEPALGNGGVGATLTNAGAQIAITIDGHLLDIGARVLVQGQTSQLENGIYDVTTVGTVSTNWVLTRSSDGDSYQPKSSTSLCAGSFFFIMDGDTYAGSSYVLTAPPGEIHVGTSNIVFTQFSSAGQYTAGNGIAITGTIISANVDGVTTDIQGGNIVVKTSAQLTTPNIGAATGTSVDLTGNVLAENVNANAKVTAANIEVVSNVTADAFYANANIVSGNITSNLELSGNTANFSGNVILNNLTVNLELAGNTANFTGNIFTLNANLGNLAQANFVNVASNTITNNLTVNLALSGNTANFTGNIVAGNISISGSGGNISGANVVSANTFSGNLLTANYANINNDLVANGNVTADYFIGNGAYLTGIDTAGLQNGTSNIRVLEDANIEFSMAGNANVVVFTGTGANVNGYLTVTGDTSSNNITATNNVSANNANVSSTIVLGNTAVYWGTLTTSMITANQTIAEIPVSGVTGVEFLVKGTDAGGGKYSVATVQSVSDGSSVDFSTFATVNLGGSTGTIVVNISGGNLKLQVTPASTNSTVWTTQFRTI